MSNKQLPIDFPSNPDVTFSGAPMVFKDRGLRGKPGSAPPFDLGKVAFSLNADRLNSLSFGHTGPTPSKKKDTTKVRQPHLTVVLIIAILFPDLPRRDHVQRSSVGSIASSTHSIRS